MKGKKMGRKWGELVTNKPLLFIFLGIILSISLGFGAKNLTMSSDYRYFFGKDNPQRIAFEKLQDVYSKDDTATFVITPKDGKVFKESTLKSLIYLTEQSWKLPFSRRVDSITNFQHTQAQGDDLTVRDLVKIEDFKKEGLSNSRLNEIETIVQNEPLLKSLLINKKSSVTAVNVTMTFPGKSQFEVPKAVKSIRELQSKFLEKFPDHELRLSGTTMLNNAFNEAGMKDMMTLTPIMYGVIIVIMFLLVRTVSGIIATVGVIFLSIIAGMGFAGWAGIPLTPPSSIAPTVIMTLAIADSVHILKSILGLYSRGVQKTEAIIEGLRVNIKPVFLTSFTTAIGFLSLNFSDTPPFHDLGNITAIGVLVAFILSVTFLPAFVSLLPMKQKVKKLELNESGKIATTMAKFINNNKALVFASTVFATIFLGLQIPKIKINDQFVKYFDQSIQFRRDADYATKHLVSTFQINFDIRSAGSQGISDPNFLKKVDDFSNYMRTIDGVKHVNSVTDTFKRLNKNMNFDKEEEYKLPTDKALAAQYLLLYEMNLPYGLDLNNQIDVDKAGTRVVVTLDDMDTTKFLEINEKAEKWLTDNAPTFMHAKGTSPAIMFSHITIRNVKGMALGTLLAFSLITIVMMISLKSFKYGIISLLPNIIPAALAFGLWSLFVGEAGFAIALVGSVTIGIVVDDTVHFLTKYVDAKEEKGLNSLEAIRYAFSNVGEALVVTSIILVVGFLVLALSTFKVNIVLGLLSAMTIGLALLIDFTFLPALLSVADEKNKTIGEKMNLKNITTVLVASLLAVGVSNSVKAEVNKGLEIAKNIDARDKGFVNQISDAEMILKNKHGQESKRLMKIKTLEVNGDGDKSLTIFKTPRDVKGTAFLSFTHTNTPDDQWLYLPALKRVKRISSNNKSGPFMGSEFAYEDLSSQEVDKYTYKYIKAETVFGVNGHVIERYPVDKNSGYTKQIVTVDEKEWRISKVDYYDRKGELMKTLTFSDYKIYPNKKWRANKMYMVNHLTGKSTTLNWSNIKFGQDISSRDFDKNALKRIR